MADKTCNGFCKTKQVNQGRSHWEGDIGAKTWMRLGRKPYGSLRMVQAEVGVSTEPWGKREREKECGKRNVLQRNWAELWIRNQTMIPASFPSALELLIMFFTVSYATEHFRQYHNAN